MSFTSEQKSTQKNVLGLAIATCGCEPMTGFYRDGCCNTGPNDLSTPMPQYGFPGLKPGDHWCVCAARWYQVQQAGFGCPIVLEATHESTLKIIPFEILLQHAAIPEQLN